MKYKVEIAGSKASRFWWIVKFDDACMWKDSPRNSTRKEARKEAEEYIKKYLKGQRP